ncbi:hypothetical protein [Saccharothrix obliqua]|uniref:hypothetical protein n=1 Tax=Saccharothrix obliqua TaxID=2861747 RepID=UPI001C5F5267|nr:hypothetical protein [Saccharothrix obliqua]MBW4718955.1 hypothetical protein [Saccharothrix obliqua]
MTVVVRLKPEPRWWVWRPGADRAPAVRLARRRVHRARARVWPAVAVPAAVVVVVLAPGWWMALGVVPLVLAGVVLLLPQRVSDLDVVLAASDRDVVHDGMFADVAQRRRARRLCEHFLAVRENADPARVARVEVLLWRALVALRDSLAVRAELARTDNRPGLAAALAESTRGLAELDRRVDEFDAALRIAVEESDQGSDPGSAARALRRVAALDPL